MHKNKLSKAATSTQKIAGFLNRDIKSQSTTSRDPTGQESFMVDEVKMKNAVDTIGKLEIIPPKELESSVKTLSEKGDVNKAMSMVLKAYTSLAKAVETNFNNCTNIAQVVDENTASFQETSEQLNDEITKVSKNHYEYVEANENDKQEIKLKTDIRHYKTQMIIYLKNDSILANSNENNSISIAEKIIKEQGLSLGKAYITKAVILSGMKRINNINKFTKYIYVHFSDSFTAERLIMEKIARNKQSSNQNNPDAIFTQPSSYDVNKIKRICHELKADKSVSKVFIGDDSIKVTLNKDDPSDMNEKPKKIHIRNFSDLDRLRTNISGKSHHIPSKTFYNKDYWQQKYPRQETKRKLNDADYPTEKRRAPDSAEIEESSPNDPKKQRRFLNKSSSHNDINGNTRDDNSNASFASNISVDM